MNPRIYDDLTLHFAKMMVGKQADSDTLTSILKSICESSEFDGGFILEISQDSVYQVKESYTKKDLNIPEHLELEGFSDAYLSTIADESFTVLRNDAAASPEDRKFLSLFTAYSLITVPVLNETSSIQGFIVFCRLAQQPAMDADSLRQLAILLHLIKGHVCVRLYQNKLVFAQATLQNILDNAGIDIYVIDFHSYDILYANKSMAAPYGGVSAFMNKKCWEVLFEGQTGPCPFCPQEKLIDEEGNPTKVYSWDYQRPFDKSWFRVFSAAFRWLDGRLAHVVTSANITENKKNEEIIQYMAHYDALTGLPNRHSLINECKHRINNAGPDTRGYLLFFDIDGFKAINDSLGHDAGDEFLILLAEFFGKIPLLKNAIYRNGGDEFVAIIDGCKSTANITENNIRCLVGFIHERFKYPWALKKGNVFCNTSVGVACYPDDGLTAEILLNLADQAMYHGKKRGGGTVCFCSEM